VSYWHDADPAYLTSPSSVSDYYRKIRLWIYELVESQMGTDWLRRHLAEACGPAFRDSCGMSVVTSDFVAAMEKVIRKNLEEFFAKWDYRHPLITRSIKTKSSPY